jgi:hypothetical protein
MPKVVRNTICNIDRCSPCYDDTLFRLFQLLPIFWPTNVCHFKYNQCYEFLVQNLKKNLKIGPFPPIFFPRSYICSIGPVDVRFPRPINRSSATPRTSWSRTAKRRRRRRPGVDFMNQFRP